MKNTLVFDQFDMVVSMTQNLINDQLTHLLKLGVIQPEFIVVQEVQDQNFVYNVLTKRSDIPKDAKGNPTCAYIDGAIHPQIAINESGSNVSFILEFRSGTAYFWQGYGPLAHLQKYDMTGWKYGVSIGLDLAALEQDDINKKIKVPDIVDQQLHHFMDSMFSVNHLFMDFESVDLLKFDPTQTDAQGAGDVGLQQFVEFMNFYLKDLIANGNPYILGYSITANDQTQIPDDQNVPDQLKPVGTTFSMFHDPANQGLSNLNYVLVTQGGHKTITGSPGIFDTNWITPQEQCDAKMIYSHSVLIDYFFLKPLYDQMSTQVYAQIKDNISVSQGNSYDQAKQPLSDGTGFRFNIANDTSGDDQYVNYYTVQFQQGTSQVDLIFKGHLYFYKQVEKDEGVCTAKAHASGTIDWSGTISLVASVDANGAPELTTQQSFKIDNSSSDSDKNTCAEAFEWIGKIIGGILDAFTGFADGGYLMKLFANLLSVQTPGIGDVGAVFGNLSNAITTVIMLPAGQTFYFKNPAADAEGNFALELTYKSENE